MPAPTPTETVPVIVRPRVACRLIGVGKTKLFAMLAAGELDRVQIGPRAIGVTMASIMRLAKDPGAL
jgi:hypothetical protein